MLEHSIVQSLLERRRVALVHDWLTTYVGGERVLEQMIALYPQAQVYTSVDILRDDERAFLQGKTPITTFAQRWPFVRNRYKSFLPLLMFAMEQLDVSESELVLSSSSAIAKGVLTGPEQLHISYVHSPMRYAWDLQHQYLREAGLTRGMKSLLARWLLHKARLWDLRTANGVDYFIANSQFIARRIWKTYRREVTVIYPPVDVSTFSLQERKEDFYLTASRLVPYKKVPAIVEAFRALPGRRLVVVGEGSEMDKAKSAAGSNVEILGYQSTAALRSLMQRAKAFIFAAEEDFGITPVEAQACGTPVIAYGRGGATETIKGDGEAQPTGVFFQSQTPSAIAGAVEEFERRQAQFEPSACRQNALRFAVDVFRERYGRFVQTCWEEFHNGRAHSVKKWAPARALAVVMLMISGAWLPSARAQQAQPPILKLTQSFSQESNLYRVPDFVVLDETLLGERISRDDLVSRTAASFNNQWALARQEIRLSGELAGERYSENDHLDNTSGNGAIDWSWKLAQRWSGLAAASYNRSLAAFANTRLFEKDLFESVTYKGMAKYELTPHWALAASAQEIGGTHDNPAREIDNVQTQGGVATLEYRTRDRDTFSLDYGRTDASFERAAARDYRDTSANFNWASAISPKTLFKGSAGYLQRAYDESERGDFQGGVWEAALQWSLAHKTQLTFSGWRNLQAYVDAESDHFISRGGSVSAAWAPTSKFVLAMQWSRESQHYLGLGPLFPGLELRQDQRDLSELRLTYSPARAWSFLLGYSYEKRDSNRPLFDYASNSVSFACNFTLL